MRDLLEIPGVGKKMKTYLEAMGIRCVEDLAGRDPEELYRRDCALRGQPVDRCALYVYRLAVYFAETAPTRQNANGGRGKTNEHKKTGYPKVSCFCFGVPITWSTVRRCTFR